MARNIIVILFNIVALHLLFYFSSEVKDFWHLLKRILIVQSVLLVIALFISTTRHFFARSLNKQKATTSLYYKRLFNAQLWIYIISLFFIVLLQISWYYDRQDVKAYAHANKLFLTSDEGLDMQVLMNPTHRDSIAKKYSVSEKYLDKTHTLLGYIESTFPLFLDSVYTYYDDSVISGNNIKVTDLHLSYERNIVNDESFFVKAVYTYKYLNERLRHMVIYCSPSPTHTVIESNNTGKYFDLYEWRDEHAEYEDSDIEIQLIDSNLVQEIKTDYDSKHYVDAHSEFSWREEHYWKNDSVVSWILYDSTGNIIGIKRWCNDSLFYKVEFYENGQQKGPIFTKELSEDDTTFAKYYRRNGRVWKMGYLTNKQIGKWYLYDTSGKLLFTQIF